MLNVSVEHQTAWFVCFGCLECFEGFEMMRQIWYDLLILLYDERIWC